MTSSSFNGIAYAAVLRFVAGNPILSYGLVLGLFLMLLVRYCTSPWRMLPPGPSGLPFIGNALQLKDEQWLQFGAWRKKYGTGDRLC